MTLAHKIMFAFVTALFSPAIIAFVAFGRWSHDNIGISIPAIVYLVPIFLVPLLISLLFRARKVAASIYVIGMGALLILAFASLWAELHGPVFGQVYIPTIVLTFPFGLMAILHRSPEVKDDVD